MLMPRFYFHLHFDHDNARDPIGVELSDLDQAIAEAKKARLEIMDEGPRSTLARNHG